MYSMHKSQKLEQKESEKWGKKLFGLGSSIIHPGFEFILQFRPKVMEVEY